MSGGHQAMYNGIRSLIGECHIFVTYPEKYEDDTTLRQSQMSESLGGDISFLPWKKPPVRKPTIVNRINIILFSIYKSIISFGRKIQEPLFDTDLPLMCNPDFACHINQIILKEHIDIVQCEMLETIGLVDSLPNTVKKVFVHHELGFVKYRLLCESKGLTALFFKQLETFKNNEIQSLNKYDLVFTLSSTDTAKLKEAGLKTPVLTSFAIVNPPAISTNACENPFELTFVGPSFHYPNVIGIKWFLENCWNELQRRDPRYHLRIIGQWRPSISNEILSHYSGVQFLGFVPDLFQCLRDTIMIVPITIGSGIRMKILEAASMGVPYVSTSVGAEGIPVTSGIHCFISDNSRDFIDCIQKLQDSTLRNAFIQNSHQMITENYSVEALRNNRILSLQ